MLQDGKVENRSVALRLVEVSFPYFPKGKGKCDTIALEERKLNLFIIHVGQLYTIRKKDTKLLNNNMTLTTTAPDSSWRLSLWWLSCVSWWQQSFLIVLSFHSCQGTCGIIMAITF